MAKRIVKKEVQEGKKAESLLDVIVEAMFELKAQNVVSLDLSKLENSICKHFVICNAESTTQVSAIADHVEDSVRERWGERVWRKDGLQNALWVILDYGDVMVHIFQTECRDFYRLEDLWADAEMQKHTDSKA